VDTKALIHPGLEAITMAGPMADPMADPSGRRMRRPREVKVAAILLAVLGVLGLLLAWLVLTLLDNDRNDGQSVADGYFMLVYLQFALSGLQVVSGVLLWRGSRVGRVLGIVLCVVNVLGAIGTLASGAVAQAIFAAALNIGLIRMLADEEVGYWIE
jgi:MFS family permease